MFLTKSRRTTTCGCPASRWSTDPFRIREKSVLDANDVARSVLVSASAEEELAEQLPYDMSIKEVLESGILAVDNVSPVVQITDPADKDAVTAQISSELVDSLLSLPESNNEDVSPQSVEDTSDGASSD